MTRSTDPTDWEARFRALERKVRELARQSALASASVTRGRVRIASAEGLVVEGSMRITGTMNGDGTMHWTGSVEFDGPVRIDGNVTRNGTETAVGATTLSGLLTVNGDAIFNTSSKATFNGPVDIKGTTAITGATTVTGTLGVSGVTTVTNDLNVTGGGNITAGNVEITPNSVRVGTLYVNQDGLLNDSSGTVAVFGNVYLTGGVSPATLSASSLIARNAPSASGQTANVYMNANGELCRI